MGISGFTVALREYRYISLHKLQPHTRTHTHYLSAALLSQLWLTLLPQHYWVFPRMKERLPERGWGGCNPLYHWTRLGRKGGKVVLTEETWSNVFILSFQFVFLTASFINSISTSTKSKTNETLHAITAQKLNFGLSERHPKKIMTSQKKLIGPKISKN